MGFRRRTGAGRSLPALRSLTTANKKASEQQATTTGGRRPGAEQYAPAAAAPQYAPPPPNPTDEIEHLAQLHASGVLTDEEFSAAKAKVLGI